MIDAFKADKVGQASCLSPLSIAFKADKVGQASCLSPLSIAFKADKVGQASCLSPLSPNNRTFKSLRAYHWGKVLRQNAIAIVGV